MRHDDVPAARTGAATLDPAGSQIAPLKELKDWRRWDPRWSPAPNQDFYAGEAYDDSRFYGPRRRR